MLNSKQHIDMIIRIVYRQSPIQTSKVATDIQLSFKKKIKFSKKATYSLVYFNNSKSFLSFTPDNMHTITCICHFY